MKNGYPCEHVIPVEQEPRHHVVIANEFIRALAVEIAPHERTLCHHHAHDYLMYVAGDAEIVSAPRDEEPKKLSYRDGECELLPAGLVHVVENVGDAPFRNIVVELMAKAAELKGGQEPTAGGRTRASVDKVLGEGIASVYVIDLQRDDAAEIDGPAIVASPYQCNVELEVRGREAITLRGFRDLAWLAPLSNGLLGNQGNSVARVVMIQLGAGSASLSGAKL